ncbi:SNF1-related protein kinase catalytic subunit alpha KIN10-like [Salvia miltiorrhiza]|uniref:SNF1-related protein kinase catalytic subunit alpha KIN10-like n=1 Tax=Salvia miltiorrhiza TaxID=226208 RepID=UPI0025ACAF2B|nr:SNF1-related protein kinase catalytic subunit alpha KIN10-like [Salvia miltiorrhiza]
MASRRRRSSHNEIPHYKIGKTLGIGAFGKVKLAVHTLTGIKVAIKILDRLTIDTQGHQAEKVRKEMNIMRQLDHPHIVRLLEVIDTPEKVYVVMEYMNSGELFYYLTEKGKLHEHEARRLFQQIISGVDYCHRHLVVHRDLKPENLLLDSDHNVKIADFGLGNIMRDGHFLKTCCGSPNYAAPELISRRLYAGPEVDVWSCGVILYALLCGRLPFDDDNLSSLYAKIKSGVYHSPNHLSESARHLISRILVVDPMKRISIPEIGAHPWFRDHLPLRISNTSQIESHTQAASPVQDKWALGFKSQASPRKTMSDVLEALHSLNVRWKKIGHYNIKCLWSPPLSHYSVPASRDAAIKFETQLYRASGEFYVVDLQQLSGPPFPFLNICAAFRALVA